ncbi:MAG: hypothetical protein RLZZ347_882 [Candidatus Parcubacteria bacterium]|jgi:D-alanyl-D-alanine carboxypeptidase
MSTSIDLDSPRYVKKALLWGIIGLIILLIAVIQQAIHDRALKVSPIAHIPTVSELLTEKLASTTLEAKSVVVYDIAHHQILFAKNAEQQLPLASLTKVMTALVATESIPEFTTITIPDEISKVDKRVIQPGQKWSLKQLLDYTLVVSSNEGARSIASVVGAFEKEATSTDSTREWFIKKMNTRARELGMSQTYFINESGLDLSEPGFVSGAYGSATDLTTLFAFTLKTHPEIFEATTKDLLLVHSQTKSYTAENTDKIINQLPGVIASKTGLTDLSGGNLVVALDIGINNPVIIAVLGSSEKGRFTDVTTLANATVEAMGSYR